MNLKMINLNDKHIDLFKEVSFDKNPLHIDEKYARKTTFGGQVVYGIGVLLKALGEWMNEREFTITEIKAQFKKPVLVNTDYELEITENNHQAKLCVKKGNETYSLFKIKFAERKNEQNRSSSFEIEKNESVQESVEKKSYEANPEFLDLFLESYSLKQNQISPNLLSFLLWSSYFIGMEQPGPQALYTQLKLEVGECKDNKLVIEKITPFSNLNSVVIEGRGAGLKSFKLNALERPVFINYSFEEVASNTTKVDSFEGKNILITGGSRGLGSVLSKYFLSNNSKVFVSYRSDLDSVNDMMNEIPSELKNNISFFQLDLTEKDSDLAISKWLKSNNVELDYVFCNAVPPINSLKFTELTTEDFVDKISSFSRVTLNTLYGVLGNMKKNGTLINISTDYLEEPLVGFSYYTGVKSLQENLFSNLQLEYPTFNFKNIRLPKMLTDQTNTSFSSEKALKPYELVPQIIEQLEKES